MMNNIDLTELRGKRLGWVVPSIRPYSRVMASTRIRAYDVINMCKEHGWDAGIYKPFLKYDLIIFQKAFKGRFLELARHLRRKGTKILLDINVNFIDEDEHFVNSTHQSAIKEMLEICDGVVVSSPFLKSLYEKNCANKSIFLIEEIIDGMFYRPGKIHKRSDNIKLVFCGYAVKAEELYLIEDVLKSLHREYGAELLFVCDRDPGIDIIPHRFIKYRHRSLPEQLIAGDIKISPRDMSRRYNLGHSFTRIGYPMSLGIPVVASPVPSYEGSPAVLCNDRDEWYKALESLILNSDERNRLGAAGKEYVKEHYSKEVISVKYAQMFKDLF